ncbi:Uncharacterised protein [Ectopseudomonas mendocina]|uniref:Class I SAM-dependent methyltransferase n=1 Tax=Ectopseudomonas mendocina TaxID=300 RepID=A0A379IY14_ECTME|nr:hypothetical protein [Pseudomonas mendocina]SUD41177.1 Uncharacterised protein [Pseudomonas mendocina]
MDNLIEDYYGRLNPGKFFGCNSKTPGSNKCLECFSYQFYRGNEISYDCEEKRKLYVLRYFPVHFRENSRGAAEIPEDVVDSWFERGHVNILSVGGGPGADVCGVLGYIEIEEKRRNESLYVDILRLDIESQWDEVFNDVMGRFFPWANHQTVHLDIRHGISSITDIDFDLVTASYLVSELDAQACLDLAEEVDSFLVEGGVLMVNDRPENSVEQNIRLMFKWIGMSYSERGLSGWAGYNYPDNVVSGVGPKLKMSSRVFVGVKG